MIPIALVAFVLAAAWRFSRGISRRLFPLHEPRLVKLLPPAPLSLAQQCEQWPRGEHADRLDSRLLLPGACRSCGWVDRRDCASEVALHGRCSNAPRRRPVEVPIAGPGATRRG